MSNLLCSLNNFFQIQNYFKIKKENKVNISAKLKNSKINIKGKKNSLIKKKGDIKKIKVGIYGDNNILEIHENCSIRDLNIMIQGKNLKIIIKNDTIFAGGIIVCAGQNSTIFIDEFCLVANNIEIRNSDGHSIFENGKLINPSSSIHISNNVWIGQNAKILKGANIGAHSVIALNALVSSGNYENNIILAGLPAKIIKKDITWSRDLPN